MRTRQKFTAVGAFTLAAGSIGGGALVTSSAMADDSTPVKGTITVISMQDGDEAIRCTFEDVDLPTITFEAPLPGQQGTGGFVISGSAVAVDAPPEGGVVFSSSLPGDALPPPPGAGEMVTVSAGEVIGDGPSFSTGGAPPPDGALPAFVFDDANAREGTAEECADLQPSLPTP